MTIAQITGGVDFALAPGFEVHVDRVFAAPFASTAWTMVGETFHGILGSSFFFDYVIEADYEKQRLVFRDTESYRYEGDGAVLELEFRREAPKTPFIRATLENGDRRLTDFPILVDSGGQTMGTASVPSRRDWDALVTPANRIVDGMGATGLSNDPEGTTHESFLTRMDRFVMGPFEFEGPRVSYSAGGPGIAVMGASLLHRFTAVFDYERKRLILEPNANFDKPPMVEQSGMFLVMSDAKDGTFQVIFVAGGTPAHEAGLTRGDVIRAVDGVPTREMKLNDARRMFCRPDEFRLDVQRDGKRLETVLETRSLFDG